MTSPIFNPYTDTMPEPPLLAIPSFEEELAGFKADVLARVDALRPDDHAAVAETMQNDAELVSIIIQACALRTIHRTRVMDEKLRQLMLPWARGGNLDAKAFDLYGLRRQVITKGDPSAVPPTEDVMESDEDFMIRILLAPFTWSTGGTEMAYRYHALTLGARPKTTISTPSPGRVVVTYDFPLSSRAAEVKDARAKVAAAETGKVNIWLLSRKGDGIPSDDLMGYAQEYFKRPDIALLTDLVTLKKATNKNYAVRLKLHCQSTPWGEVDTGTIEARARELATQLHMLEGTIDPHRFSSIAYGMTTPVIVEVLEPAAVITCGYGEAPFCTSVTVEAVYE